MSAVTDFRCLKAAPSSDLKSGDSLGVKTKSLEEAQGCYLAFEAAAQVKCNNPEQKEVMFLNLLHAYREVQYWRRTNKGVTKRTA